MMAWLYTFCGVFLELPLSQLLYAPGSPPASIAIEDNLSNYHFGVGMAQAVLAVAIAFGVVAVVLGGYRLLAPRGWRRIGRNRPWLRLSFLLRAVRWRLPFRDWRNGPWLRLSRSLRLLRRTRGAARPR